MDTEIASADASSEDDTTSPEPSAEPEPTPIPASSEGPAQNWPVPEPPQEIYEPTEEGARELLDYWFETRHYARITGDTEPLKYVSHEDCEICGVQVDRIEEVFPSGWFVEDGDEVLDAYVRLEAKDHVTGLFILRENGFDTYTDGRLHTESSPQPDGSYGMALIFEEDRWKGYDFNWLGDWESEDDLEDSNEIGLFRRVK